MIFLSSYDDWKLILRNDNSIIPETKPDRFLKPVKFGLKVSEVIKALFLTKIISEKLSHYTSNDQYLALLTYWSRIFEF